MNKEAQTQISDKAVLEATNKNWEEWFTLLDVQGGQRKTHKEIVTILKAHSTMNGWWQQTVTVEYEKARGLRKKHETTDGFQISKSKTFGAGIEAVYGAWSDEKSRQKWLDTPCFTIRKANENKSLRITWVDGKTHVDAHFYPKEDKTQVSINHKKLMDADSAENMKAFWEKQLNQLADHLK